MTIATLSELVVRLAYWVVARGLFRIRVVGRENIPRRGPALLAANHVTFMDAFIIGYCVRPVVRFLVWRPYYRLKLLNWGLRLARAIPVGTGPHDLAGAIRAARRELGQGQIVCIFPEAFITRTGNLLPFRRGLEVIARGLDVPIIPIHLDGLWGSIFSFEGGRAFWKWPRRLRHPAIISFGAPMPASSTTNEVRDVIQELGAEAGALIQR
ncbi:MAG: 1-acyl-sn-glycerol-3-phosphate acyltransferase [Acidobacteriia bacterium]|nr:1-acyl-sn-glycerol-3-phosphate acyltransferase [Terriglobia bacterium]